MAAEHFRILSPSYLFLQSLKRLAIDIFSFLAFLTFSFGGRLEMLDGAITLSRPFLILSIASRLSSLFKPF